MTWILEMKFDTIFIYNTYTCNYDIKYNYNVLHNNKV